MMRRLQLLLIAGILLIAAFSTGLAFLFYLVYLAILVIGGSYIVTRLGLSDLEAGYAVSQLSGHVGDRIRVTYTLRNTSRIPKPWLEVHNPTTLPGGLPGRAIPLGARIISVADTYDAMTSSRAYRAGRSHGEAVTEIKRVRGTQLDPEVVDAFLRVCERDPSWIGTIGAPAGTTHG